MSDEMSDFVPGGLTVQRTPSAGKLIKQIHEINPELGVQEISAIIHRATIVRGAEAAEYANVAVIDEELAIQLARESVINQRTL